MSKTKSREGKNTAYARDKLAGGKSPAAAADPKPKKTRKAKAAKGSTAKGDRDPIADHLNDIRAIAVKSEKLRIKYEEAKTAAREALQAWNACRDQLVRESLDETSPLFGGNHADDNGSAGGMAGVVQALKKPKRGGV